MNGSVMYLNSVIRGVTVKTINIDEFNAMSINHLTLIDQLFVMKNKQYASTNDVLSAFKQCAERQFGEVTQDGAFKTCMQFKDKHDLALLQHGTMLPDAKERLYDIIVYCLLGLAVLSGKDEQMRS